MASLRRKKQSDLDTLRLQRDELRARLERTEAQAATLDPLDQWEDLSRLASEAMALERAVSTADDRIALAELEEAKKAVDDREQAQYQRRIDAIGNATATAERVSRAAMEFRGGVLADMEAAIRELNASGAYMPSSITPAWRIVKTIDGSLTDWRRIAPTWFGLPEALTARERAIQETADAIQKASDSIAELRQQARAWRGNPGDIRPDFAQPIRTHAYALRGNLGRLAELTGQEINIPDFPELIDADSRYSQQWEDGRKAREARAMVEGAAPDQRPQLPKTGLVNVDGTLSPAPAS